MKQKILFITRVAMGWVMLYAGLTKVFNPNWSAAGYLGNAKTFAGFYNWFLQPDILPFTNFINEWGLTLLGLSLIVGALVRYSGYLGALLMFLYYFPVLTFPKIGANSYIVDDHIIYVLILVLLSVYRAGGYWGLDGWWKGRNSKTGLIEKQAEEKEDNKRRILGILETQSPLTNNHVEQLLGVSDATATRYLDELEKEGKVRQVGDTGAGVYYERVG